MTATVMMKMMLTLIVVNNSFSNLKVSLLGVSFLVLVVYHSNFIYVFVVFILELFSVISFLIQLAPELVFTHTPAPFFKNAHLLSVSLSKICITIYGGLSNLHLL